MIHSDDNGEIVIDCMSDECRNVVARQMVDNFPFTDRHFDGKDVVAMAEEIKLMLEKDPDTKDFIANIYVSAIQKQPIYIDYDKGKWSYFTMKEGTKKQLMDEMKRVHEHYKKQQIAASLTRPMNRAERRKNGLI